MADNRRKGHQYERDLRKFFYNLGYSYVKTSRNASKLLDDCGVDLAFLPFLVQAKAGYKKNRPKFEVIYNYIKSNIKENYPEEDAIHSKPIILCHKLDGYKDENHQITMSHKDIEIILEQIKSHFDKLYQNKYKNALSDVYMAYKNSISHTGNINGFEYIEELLDDKNN